MSLLGGGSEVPIQINNSVVMVRCKTCGKEYYTQVPAGSAIGDVITQMVCSCGNGDLAA